MTQPVPTDRPKIQLNILPLEHDDIPKGRSKQPPLKDKYPKIFAQIHPTLNKGININTLTCSSHKKLWWICPLINERCEHHVWLTAVSKRTIGRGCPYCTGHKTCRCQSFVIKYPHLALEFDRELNPGINPETISLGSHISLKWRCRIAQCGHHIWETSPNNRSRGNGCPYCAGHRTCPCDSFIRKYPHLALEFDRELNPGIDPKIISCGSHICLTWRCLKSQCGHHIWSSSVSHRTKGCGCPFCVHVRTCPCDSFLVKYPHLALEFDRELNPGIDPETVAPMANIYLTWRCINAECGHYIWTAILSCRTSRNVGCPKCKSSLLEKAMMQILDQLQVKYKHELSFDECRYDKPLYFDIYLPDYNAIIEGDGLQHFKEVAYFHKGNSTFEKQKTKDGIKNDFCRIKGIHLLRISYSELNNVATHVYNFITAIIAACPTKTRVETFAGREYTPVE